jgi:hypothetical protein
VRRTCRFCTRTLTHRKRKYTPGATGVRKERTPQCG